MHQSEESLQDVLRYARKRGHQPSRAQIRRFQQNGLIPKPRQVGLGRGVGTEVRYPNGTGAQLVAACKAIKSKSFDIARWQLWWDGWPIDGSWIRKDLLAHTQESVKRDRMPREVRRRLNPALLKQFRDLETGLRTGVFPAPVDPNVERVFARASGLSAFLTQTSGKSGSAPLKLGDTLLAFARVSSTENTKTVLQEATDGEMELAREEVKAFIAEADSLHRLFEVVDLPTFGRRVAALMESPSHDSQKAALEIWLTIRKIPLVRAVYTWLLALLVQPSPIVLSRKETPC